MPGALAIKGSLSRAGASTTCHDDWDGQWDKWLNWDDTAGSDWGDARYDIPPDAPGSS